MGKFSSFTNIYMEKNNNIDMQNIVLWYNEDVEIIHFMWS